MNGFTRKKVKSLTLGERLRKMREDRRISLNEASRHTRIQAKYLEFLENGEYDKLPADVYVRGFVGNYSEYLGGDMKKLVMLFEKERGIRKNIEKTTTGNESEKKISVSGVIITPKIMGAIGVVVVFVLAFSYLYKEFHSFVSMPRLVIKHPLMSHETVANSSIIFEGVTDRENEVVINDIKISVNEDGEFSQEISLNEGVNIISVKSVNRFGKETTKEFFINSDMGEGDVIDYARQEDVIDQPEESERVSGEIDGDVLSDDENIEEAVLDTEEQEEEIVEKHKLEIRAKKNSVNVIISEGGVSVYSGKVRPDSPQKIAVEGDVLVTSDDGNDTIIYVDGEKVGLLNKESGE
ncbi:helix-turn-helix domain-containing protein, partial [Patescibacteria group bacterium]